MRNLISIFIIVFTLSEAFSPVVEAQWINSTSSISHETKKRAERRQILKDRKIKQLQKQVAKAKETTEPVQAHEIDSTINLSDEQSGGLDVHNTFTITRDDVALAGLENAKSQGPYYIVTTESNSNWAEKVKEKLTSLGKGVVEVRLFPDDMAGEVYGQNNPLYDNWLKRLHPNTIEHIEQGRLVYYSVPENTTHSIRGDTKPVTLKGLFVKPDKTSVILGSVMTAFRGTVAFAGTYIIQGVDLQHAMAYTVASMALSAAFAISWKTIDNLFAISLRNFREQVSEQEDQWRRRAFDLGSTEVTSAIHGNIPTAPALWSLPGQGQIGEMFLFFTLAGSRFSTARAKMFQSPDRHFANKWIAFDISFVTAMLFTLKQLSLNLGTWYSVDIHHLAVTFTTVDALVLGSFLGGEVVMRKFPQFVLKVASKQEVLYNKLFGEKTEDLEGDDVAINQELSHTNKTDCTDLLAQPESIIH